MQYESYFPRGIARGKAFCNRTAERKRLAHNLSTGHHTLLISSRRYGKTSLVRYLLAEMKLPHAEADLFVAIDAHRIEHCILNAIKTLLGSVSTSLEQTLASLRDFFKKTNSNWVVGTQGISLSLVPAPHTDPATNIMEALLALEHFLVQKKTRAVLFIDEIQEIGEVAEGKGIEGAIRHVAQQSQCLSFVFSGSRRHLLSGMFFDKARPLYKLCDHMTVSRISAEHYKKHINHLALKRWGAQLGSDSLDLIFELTGRHPYYMNTLCLSLWEGGCNSPPESKEVRQAWQKYVIDSHEEIQRELSMLTLTQRKILIHIARDRGFEMTGKVFLQSSNVAGSTVCDALTSLKQKDYIEQVNEEYTIIDPLIKSSLEMLFSDE